MATPDYSGWLRWPQGFSVPAPRASLAFWGKHLPDVPVSPVPVPSTSMIAGLGRDSPYAGLWPVFSSHTNLN